MDGHGWVVVADSPFLPAQGGGEREHVGFVEAAVAAGRLATLVVPTSEPLPVAPYRDLLGDVPVLATGRDESKRHLLHPVRPYVVASRPVPKTLVDRVRALAPDATGVVVFSYKSWRIGQALAVGLGLPAVLRQHNLEGAYHRALARTTPGAHGLVLALEAARIERDERRLERAPWLRTMADISAKDAEVRRRRGGRAVHVPPFAYDASLLTLERKPTTEPRALFIGALDVATNTAALDWLLDGVWPEVRRRVPDAVLDVVGRNPAAGMRARLAAMPGVSLHADVPRISPFLAGASVALNPAVAGSGVNIKLVDYMLAGLPAVSTTLGAEGMGLQDGTFLAVADEPQAYAASVADLLGDPDRAERLGAAGRDHVAHLLDPKANIQRLDEALA